MNNCSTAIYSMLSTDAGVLAAVSTIAGKPAIFPNNLPEKAKNFPLILFRVERATSDYSLAGPSDQFEQKMVIDCLAMTYDAAANLAGAVTTALVGKGGNVGGDLFVFGIFADDDAETSDGIADLGDALTVHQSELAFKVYFRG